MAIKIALEFGHTSMLRARTTPEGYTHDWDLYVRGVDNADISQYVKKVVFVLHDTFSNPKRTVKNPPYSLKESGYAGFILPIVIHLKNNEEPKKIEFQYDLTLQDCGPPLNSVMTHTELFINPSDEFRRKLLKGGGISVPITEEGHDKSESKVSVPMVGKPKLSGSDTKKHRVSEPKTVFADLFGVPIKTSKVSPENKSKTGEKTSYQKLPPDKSEKNESKAAKTKHSPHKDGKRDKNNSDEKEKKDKKGKDVTRDKERSKEKSKRPPSPVSSKNSHASPSSKRPSSPTAAPAVKKQQLSPPDSVNAQKSSSSPKIREKDHKKLTTEKESSKDKDKVKEAPKSSSSSGGTNSGSLEELKNDKKKKKYKDEKDPDRKDKTRDKDRDKVKEPKSSDSKKSLDKVDKHDKTEKDKSLESKQPKDGKKSPKPVKEDRSNSKSRSDKPPEVVEKVKDARSDKDRQKHKHRKKEKKERTDDSRERERRDKRDKQKNYEKESAPVTSNPPQTNSAIVETHDRDNSSDSANSGDEEDSKTMLHSKIEPETVKNNTESQRPARPLSPGSDHVKRERSDKVKKEKLKPVRGSNATGSTAVGGGGTGSNNGNEERDNRKRKRRSDSKGEEEVPAKREKDTGFSPPLEPVSSSQSPVTVEMTAGYTAAKELPEEMETVKQEFEHESEQIAPDSTNSVLIESETDEPLVFSEDYVSQLKDLQQKIMTLQDNQELQRVVQVIAATGQYEITRKTFDFDLCALDRRTVQRLQQFFSAS